MDKRRRGLQWLTGLLGCGVVVSASVGGSDARVDFRYSPPQWQAAICLPDDPQKSLVDRNGSLLCHWNLGGSEFGTTVGVEVVPEAEWRGQQLHSPRVPIVCTRRAAAGLEIVEQAFADTRGGTPRMDIILVRVTNTGGAARTVHPRLAVRTSLGCRQDGRRLIVRKEDVIASSLGIVGPLDGGRVPLEAVEVPAGGSAEFTVTWGGGPLTAAEAQAACAEAVEYWHAGAGLPYGRIEVPDPGIQALLDSSVRNIWQAREIKDGLPAFQVGPTCYRGLWIVDGAFLLEAATMLGAGEQARSGVAYELTHQQEDGRIEVMENYWKENGIVLWTCARHAVLTQDKAWLESVWPRLQRIARHLRELRERTLRNDTPLDDGLNPPGFIDGGLSGRGKPEYSNVHWNLAGLRAFIGAARWLGKAAEADEWRRDYDAQLAAFRKAAARDMTTDAHGNRYVPILMGNATEDGRPGGELPQRGQWTFCHAVYPGQIFARDDPLVAGTLAMLEATEREGMVHGTGWDAQGLWNYFASFYGHAWLIELEPGKAHVVRIPEVPFVPRPQSG